MRKKFKQSIPNSYRQVAGMSGQELLDGLAVQQKEGIATIILAEIEFRLVDKLPRLEKTKK